MISKSIQYWAHTLENPHRPDVFSLYYESNGAIVRVHRNIPIVADWFNFKDPAQNSQSEFDNLNKLYDGGISVPKPITVARVNVYNMDAIGTARLKSVSHAPRLAYFSSAVKEMMSSVTKWAVVMENIPGSQTINELVAGGQNELARRATELEGREYQKLTDLLGRESTAVDRTDNMSRSTLYSEEKDKVYLISHIFL